MAPDSSLLRHHLGGPAAAVRRSLLTVAALCFLSVFISTFQAQARTDHMDFPGSLASLPYGLENLTREVAVPPVTLPPPPDALAGTPTVLWRNRIQIPINEPLIKRYIRFYQGVGRNTVLDALDNARTCLPQMTEILESYGVPAELVWVVLVESRFEKHASYRGAVGYWQLMAATARDMGLRVDRWVDERKDPIKSTKAAAKYLRLLYERYDSWSLALAAYNAGTVPVSCVAGSRRVKDGELYGQRLPARFRAYVSKVLAAVAVLREPEKYGFENPKYIKPKGFDPVMVKSPLKLKEIAGWIDVPVRQLQELNPSLRRDAVPPDSRFALRLPSGSREKFQFAYDVHTRR